jgi:phosphoglycerol transferase MdoB-like AlkP superfamily enzyme
MITANKYVVPKYIPLLLNTPFTIINTIAQSKEGVSDFYSLSDLSQKYSPVHKFNSDSSFRKMNVVIFILESFGKEYTDARSQDGRSFTPFLDTLKSTGLYCPNAYANASRSMDAMPPILGGFPSLLRTSFVNSAYSVNKIAGLAALLRNEDYKTAFFHGGHNGTMGFDMFAFAAGFNEYYGKNEYNNDADFDGGWGIWDEPFFHYMAEKVNTYNKPFLSVVFSLSSHDPYPLPDKMKDTLFAGEPKILRSVAYTDYSLRQFFETASKMDWYKNTLFVLVPDHTSLSFSPKYGSLLGKVSIPIIYYCPSDPQLHGDFVGVTQQLDIMPSVLDYLHYNRSFISYGKSIFEPGYRFSVSFNGTNYQVVDSSHFILFDGNRILQLNHFRTDSLLENDLIGIDTLYRLDLEKNTKAYLQEYFFRLNNNALSDTFSIKQIVKSLP